jgi:hypothetical protein
MLPSFFFDDPALFVATIMEHREAFLEKVWDDLGLRVEENDGPGARLDNSGLKVFFERLPQEIILTVVEMPEAMHMPEAHYVAFIYQLPESDVSRSMGEARGISRVLTLEYGLNYDGNSPRTVLCEWTEDGTHMNMGDGPAATLEDFTTRVREMV